MCLKFNNKNLTKKEYLSKIEEIGCNIYENFELSKPSTINWIQLKKLRN